MSDAKELERLKKQFGAFEQTTFEFKNVSPGFAEWVKKATRRRGEIILVVPRGTGRVLLHTKPHYPENVYRLPTGGVHQGEDAVKAAKREGYEEMGFKPGNLKLLGVLDHVFLARDTTYVYPSFVFQTQELDKEPKPTDPNEPISGFREVDQTGLRDAAKNLATLARGWNEWGRFRAAAHLWLAERWTLGN